MVVLGDGNGTAGFGYGKALTAASAINKAGIDAEKYMFSLPLTEDRRLQRGFKQKQDGVIVELRVLPRGAGVHGGFLMMLLCEAFGIDDVTIKAHGRRNPKNLVRAFFTGLHKTAKSQRTVAEGRGLKYFDPARDYRYKSQRPSRTPSGVWTPTVLRR